MPEPSDVIADVAETFDSEKFIADRPVEPKINEGFRNVYEGGIEKFL